MRRCSASGSADAAVAARQSPLHAVSKLKQVRPCNWIALFSESI